MKLIALDVGTKRIGVAKADSSVRIAVPYPAVEVDDGEEFKKIASLARAWDINSFVLGLPRNSQGEETEQSRYVRKFAKELKRAIPDAKICFQDESLTSVEAEKRLKSRKKGYKKGDIDSEAATIILQDFLEEHTGKPTSKATAARHQSVKAAKPHKLLMALFIVIILLAAAAAGAYYFYDQNIQPVFTEVDCDEAENASVSACKPVVFNIEPGAGVADVAVGLKNAGLIRNSIVFQIFYRLNYSDCTIKTGEYELTKAMSLEEIIALITEGKGGNVFSLTFNPGETLRDLRAKLLKVGYDGATIDEALQAPYEGAYSWIFEGRPEEAGLEGYLYGETYEFYQSDTVEDIIERMLTEMADVIEENDFRTKFEAQGLNLYQGITLASIVQKEANNAADQAKVAQVFYNRLAQGMSLGSDVTTQYAVDLVDPDRKVYTNNAEALQIDSPYNTRLYPGLPYGPISNPGIQALKATATPDSEASNYLFFLTGDDGVMYYSTTDAEHQQNIVDHCAELCNVAL
jgi:UPF0755 protein